MAYRRVYTGCNIYLIADIGELDDAPARPTGQDRHQMW